MPIESYDLEQVRPRSLTLATVVIEVGLFAVATGVMLIAGIRPAVSLDPADLALGAIVGAAMAGMALALVRSRVRLLSRLRADFELVVALFKGLSIAELGLIALLAGIGEEMFFRGLLQTWLMTLTNPHVAIVVVAMMFGLAHAVSRSYVVFAFVLGLVLGYLYYGTGSLPSAMIAHALYDFIALVYGARVLAARA